MISPVNKKIITTTPPFPKVVSAPKKLSEKELLKLVRRLQKAQKKEDEWIRKNLRD